MNLKRRAINLDDFRKLAARRLPRFAYDFIEGAAEDEVGAARNRAVFDRYALWPRYLVDVSQVDQSVELFGHRYSSPFGISPTGIVGLFRPGGDRMLAEAAAEANIPFIMSSASALTIEEAARIAPQTTWFQIYGTKDWALTAEQISRSLAAGIGTLVLTVDTPTSSRRERNMRNGFGRPLTMHPSMIYDALTHPRWLLDYFRSGGLPMMSNWAAYAKSNPSANDVADVFGKQTPNPRQNWETVKKIRELWPRPLVIKGLLHPEDAALAAKAGLDGIIVSNHGGRQIDRAPSPLDVISDIRAAVDGKIPVMLDSGVRRGSDVLISMSLGASFTFFGRPTLYGAAVAGRAGIDKVIAIMRQEIALDLGQMGCPNISDLGPQWIKDLHAKP